MSRPEQRPDRGPRATGRVQRVRYELRRRDLTVAAVQRISTNFVAVTLTGEALADFASGGFDDHVKLLFAADSGEPVRRDYTPRRFDAARRELTIEFALHGDGHACQWAANAKPGDALAVGGPRGSMIVPTDYPWHLLCGDETALPAIHRRLEELPAGTRAQVAVFVEDEGDVRQFQTAADAQVHWVRSADELLRYVSLPLPAGEGYVWAAGEAGLMAAIRHQLLDVQGHPREAARIAAYWKRGAADHHEELA